jgi:two-component system, NarL family, sensor histidine kinase UhpB
MNKVGIKFRLNLLISVAFIISMVLGGMFALHNYRRAVSTETEASAQLVLGLLSAARGLSHSPAEAAQFRDSLIHEIPALTQVRHVRLEVFDAAGNSLIRSPLPPINRTMSVPHWFIRLISPAPRSYRLPIELGLGSDGFVTVTTDPDDEVAEEWTNTRDILGVAALFFLGLWILVLWYVSYALRPMDDLHAAFESFGRGESVRAPVSGTPELSKINRKFNEMADALERASGENRSLTQRLINLRDEERRAIARELHDNLAQYLFAIRTDAFAIDQVASGVGTGTIGDAAHSISESAARMEAIVREMIQQLRPLVLDELGLPDALRDLVATWRKRNPRIVCDLHIDLPLPDTSKEAELAIYNVVQESLTNVAKHSGASAATVAVTKVEASVVGSGIETSGAPPSLQVTIEDNGRGVTTGAAGNGMGLVGMRERVETLGGYLETSYRAGRGRLITARLPLSLRDRANAA